uniref:Zinc finger CCHC domain-containing protein 17 n=1 Tax=Gasterosteus aculeatus aculeatus TaxID=481459 RepID=G3NQ42_GASAC
MSDSDGIAQEPTGLDGLPPMHSISKGEVVSVQTYGAFVRLPGYKKEGLVHVSEMSASRVENASEIVDMGEKVWIKVIGREMRDDKVKLSFSMKAVNQGTGQDLDPNNVMGEQDARRRRQFRDHTGNRITLEAVLNTTCSKCGCKGHFTKDCFSAPGLHRPRLHHSWSQAKRRRRRRRRKPRRRGRERSRRAAAAAAATAASAKPRRGAASTLTTKRTKRKRNTRNTNRTNTAETDTQLKPTSPVTRPTRIKRKWVATDGGTDFPL